MALGIETLDGITTKKEKEMKITIDTQTDSKEEIRKAISLLMGLVGGHEVFTNEPEKPSGIFDSPDPTIGSETPAVGNMMSLFDNPEKAPESPETKEKKSQVQFY